MLFRKMMEDQGATWVQRDGLPSRELGGDDIALASILKRRLVHPKYLIETPMMGMTKMTRRRLS